MSSIKRNQHYKFKKLTKHNQQLVPISTDSIYQIRDFYGSTFHHRVFK